MQGTEGDASSVGGVRGRMQRRVQGGCEQHGGSGGGASRARCRPQGRRPQGGREQRRDAGYTGEGRRGQGGAGRMQHGGGRAGPAAQGGNIAIVAHAAMHGTQPQPVPALQRVLVHSQRGDRT